MEDNYDGANKNKLIYAIAIMVFETFQSSRPSNFIFVGL